MYMTFQKVWHFFPPQTGKIQSCDVHDIPESLTLFCAQTGKIQSYDVHDIPESLTLFSSPNRQDTELWCTWHSRKSDTFLCAQTGKKIQTHDVHKSDTFLAQTGKIQSHDVHDIPISMTPCLPEQARYRAMMYMAFQKVWHFFLSSPNRQDTEDAGVSRKVSASGCSRHAAGSHQGLLRQRPWSGVSLIPLSVLSVWSENRALSVSWFMAYISFSRKLLHKYFLSRILGECHVTMMGNYL